MMGSTPIAIIRGIPVRVHFSLYLALFFFVWQLGSFGVVAGVLLFASVLAHELGHALVARRLGIGIAGIELHLLGGAALMTSHPEDPRDEVIIAAAGPAVSFLLGGAALVLAWLTGGVGLAPSLANVVSYVAVINLAMGLFNLIPALPMDGGRILRGLLVPKMGALPATRLAAHVARGFAVLFGLGGVVTGNWSLPLIAIFVWTLAGREEHLARLRAAEAEVRAERARQFWEAQQGWYAPREAWRRQ